MVPPVTYQIMVTILPTNMDASRVSVSTKLNDDDVMTALIRIESKVHPFVDVTTNFDSD